MCTVGILGVKNINCTDAVFTTGGTKFRQIIVLNGEIYIILTVILSVEIGKHSSFGLIDYIISSRKDTTYIISQIGCAKGIILM